MRLAAIAVLLIVAGPASADLCAQIPQKDSFRGSPLVFLGTVEAVDDTFVTVPTVGRDSSALKDLPVDPRPRRLYEVHVRVDALWKGTQRDRVTLLCSPSEWSFTPRGTYLVYADSSALGYSVGLCSRVLSRSRADSDLQDLGQPRIGRVHPVSH